MDEFVYRYEDHHLDLMREQVWEARDDIKNYTGLAAKEFSQFLNYIGEPKTIMELGCGLGRGSVYLNWLLKNPDAFFILADRDGRTTNSGAFAPVEDEHYNDFKLTYDFCWCNNLSNFVLFDTERDDWTSLPKIDFFFSLCSFGMHVSIERYMERLIDIAEPNATMVFGVRHPSYSPNSFADRFEEVIYLVGNHGSERSPGEDWLILKNPKGG